MTTLPTLRDQLAKTIHDAVCGCLGFRSSLTHMGRYFDGADSAAEFLAAQPERPLHLPDVDTVARKIYESDGYPSTSWDDRSDSVKDSYRANARDVLELIAAHQPVWHRVEPGTLIKAGTRYRRETLSGPSYEFTAVSDFLAGDGNISIDPRTVPAPTLTERIRAALADSPESRITLDAADVEALLNMAGGEDK